MAGYPRIQVCKAQRLKAVAAAKGVNKPLKKVWDCTVRAYIQVNLQQNLIAIVINITTLQRTGVARVFYILELKQKLFCCTDAEKDHVRGIAERQFNSRAGCTEAQRLGETKQLCTLCDRGQYSSVAD